MSAASALPAPTDGKRASPFSRAGVLGLVVIGFALFLAMLYFLSTGDTGPNQNNNGRAHAASKGLNGFSALVELLEADDYTVTVSRERGDLDTSGLLILTPPKFMDADELSEIIEDRQYSGPTMVILPKWFAIPSRMLTERVKEPEKIKRGWVMLSGASKPGWADSLEGDMALELERDSRDIDEVEIPEIVAGIAPQIVEGEEDEEADPPENRRWSIPSDAPYIRNAMRTMSGQLPSPSGFFLKPTDQQTPMVLDGEGNPIVVSIRGLNVGYELEENEVDEGDPNWVVFVVEPDLMNNWGLADDDRALAALELVRAMGYTGTDRVTFDLTLNGFGGSMNLLTLAFTPPFLAATLCLLLAIVIIGWRAFRRFGPSAAGGRTQAFGKAQLVTNGAELIVRARRLNLLAEPYITLSARRLARALGLAKPDPEAIDAALAQRLPDEAPFTLQAERLRAASGPTDILRAAGALNDLTGKLTK